MDFPNSIKLLKVKRQEILSPSFASVTPNLCGQTSPTPHLCEILYSIDSWNQFLLSKLKFCLATCWNQVLYEAEGASLSLYLYIIYIIQSLFLIFYISYIFYINLYFKNYIFFPSGAMCQIPQTPNCPHKHQIPGRRLNFLHFAGLSAIKDPQP